MTNQNRATDDQQDHDLKSCFGSDFSMEWIDLQGKMTDVRITKGAARYSRRKRLRNWLYHRAPWLPSWITGWKTIRYRSPDPLCSNARLLLKFGEQKSTKFPPLPFPPDAMTNPVVEAVKASTQLKPGWHTAMIRFKLDDDGNLTAVDEYKVSSFGEVKP
jgi:hypothetical protein